MRRLVSHPHQWLNDLDSLLQSVPPKPEKGILAIRSCGSGDITTSHLGWKGMRGLPAYSSPLFYKGRLFTIKSGGLLSAYNVKDGSPVFLWSRPRDFSRNQRFDSALVLQISGFHISFTICLPVNGLRQT